MNRPLPSAPPDQHDGDDAADVEGVVITGYGEDDTVGVIVQ